MIHVYLEFNVIENMALDDEALSPEELLALLEEKMDNGELTIDEVQQFIIDYQRTTKP